MNNLRQAFRELRQYPSAIAGSFIIFSLVMMAVYTVIAIPYNKAIGLWRGGLDVWYRNPSNAQPLWVNYFRRDKLPESFYLASDEAHKVVTPNKNGFNDITITFPFTYDFASFPQELTLYFNGTYNEKQPYVSALLTTPDGREVRIIDSGIERQQTFLFSQDSRLKRRVGGLPPNQGVFLNPESD